MKSTRPYTTKHDRPLCLESLSLEMQTRILAASNPQIAIDVLAKELYCEELAQAHRGFLNKLQTQQDTTELLLWHHSVMHGVGDVKQLENSEGFLGWVAESKTVRFAAVFHPYQGVELVKIKEKMIVWRSSGRFYDDEPWEGRKTALEKATAAAIALLEAS